MKDYLPRLYKTPLVAQLTNKQMFMSWFTKTRMKIRGARLQSRGLVNEVPIEKVKLAEKFGWKVSSLADGDNLPQNLLDVLNSGGKIPAKYNGTKIVMWRDFTESERQDMGEVRDAVLRYAMGYVETQRDVAIGRLFKAVANNPDLAKTYNPGGWVQVPNVEIKGAPGTKTYGALAGMYVEPQVADSLKRNTQPKGVLMAAYDKALGWWKEGKTVWNPVSHGNNVVSNIFVMHFAGLNPANPANWRNTVREYRTKGQYYKEAVDKGLFGTEWATMEIQNLLMPDLADMADIESVASSRVSKMAEFLKKTGKPVSWYRENMQRAYEFEDQFFKLMIYSDRRKAGMTPEEAIEDTERYIFNYADLPEGVENIKRVYSPFFSYTYKAVPMVIHTAMTRPDRLLVPLALLSGANWLGYLISGGDEDKERKGLPDYMQGRSAIGTQKAVRMPFNVEGKPAFMDVTRRVPLGDLFDVNNQTNGLPVPAPLMPSHPLLSMTAAIAWNVDTFSGKDLVKKSDTAWEAAQTRAGYVYKQLAPNAPFVPGSYNFNKLMDAAAYTFDTELGPYTGRTKAGDPVPLSTTLPDVFTGTKIDDDLYEELETALLMADAGVRATEYLLKDLKQRVKDTATTEPSAVKALLAASIAQLLKPLEQPLTIGAHKPTIIMVAGVNGAGKTTSIGKLTRHLSDSGASVLLAAADTFRAAAREQLAVWATRNTVEIVSQEGGDPASVSFDAVTAGRARGKDVVLVDTAGRLPTQLHLMEELKKIKRVVQKADETGPHEVLLVIDGNTGQNALAQVKAFDEALGLTGLIVTKLDGTAKGGVLAAIALWGQSRAAAGGTTVPVYFIGVGEAVEDLETFSAQEFADALLG